MRPITVGHSPDADDAFMFFALAQGYVRIEGPEPCVYHEVHADIQTLNARAQKADLDMTQISAEAYPALAQEYRITACGSSMGLDYGPIVVAREAAAPAALRARPVAIPGEQTTAHLLARLYLPPFEPVPMAFDRVMEAVRAGEVEAAVVIHEGQLSYPDHGLVKLFDLGRAWFAETGLPLPLGINVVRRELSPEWRAALGRALWESIEYAEAHPEPALAYARRFARGMDAERSEAFTRMYVNELTLDMGESGVRALDTLYRRAHRAGLLAAPLPVDVQPV